MCVNPISVKNNSLKFRPWIDRLYNIVPCGKCYECQEQNKSDYRTRAVFEYLSTIKNGGCVYFYTLTYNDDHIPKYNDITCFDKSDLQKFFKRLRKNYDIEFKYFVTSEYGDNTFRPHYHLLLFFPYKLDSNFVHDAIENTWKLGFIKAGDNYGLVYSVTACSYVAKYISKSYKVYDALEKKGFTSFDLQKFINYTSYYGKEKGLKKPFKSSIKKGLSILPFHLQSTNFGLGMVDYLSDVDWINNCIVLPTADKLTDKFYIPKYIKRKVLYKKIELPDNKVIYRLNEKGIEIKKKQILDSIHSTAVFYSTLLDSYTSCYYKSQLLKYFSTFENFKSDFEKLIYSDFQLLASYNLVYRGREYSNLFLDSLKDDINFIFSATDEDYPFYTDELEKSLNHNFDIFKDFDYALNLLTEIKKYVAYENYLSNTFCYNINQRFRSQRTGKFKPLPVLQFSSFCNSKTYNRTSSILFTNRQISLTKSCLQKKFQDVKLTKLLQPSLKSLRLSMMKLH